MEITPTSITNFNRTERELQVFALFCIFVAGKNSDFAAKKVDAVVAQFPKDSLPFDGFCKCKDISDVLIKARTGQYTRLTNALHDIIALHDSVGLSNVTLEQLMSVNGIGPKTAAFFIMHSRKGERHAVLDTHILKWIRSNGYADAPKTTPPVKQYSKWENIFFDLVGKHFPALSLAEVDLKIWTETSGRA
jgi:thermostable 8-oxoguanine DNA glycosylase